MYSLGARGIIQHVSNNLSLSRMNFTLACAVLGTRCTVLEMFPIREEMFTVVRSIYSNPSGRVAFVVFEQVSPKPQPCHHLVRQLVIPVCLC